MQARRWTGVVFAVGIVATAAPVPAGGLPAPFTEEALARGLDYPMAAYPQSMGYVGQGSGFVDLDSDGDPDIVVIGRANGRVGIFQNVGGGNFVEHTSTSGLPTLIQQEGFAAADYDGDGFLDLYITQANNRPNYLMKNNGNFTFTDVTLQSGTSNGQQISTGPTWGDYNNDGWLDFYVCNYGTFNALYRNNGNGTFTNVAGLLGVTGGTALSFQTVWSDYDRDGDVDLYLSNDRAPLGFPKNMLWRNNGGLSFTDVSIASGANVSVYSMGIGAGDVDNNAYPDYYVTNINSVDGTGGAVEYDGINPLLLNQGNGTFTEAAESWDVDHRITSWAAIFFDWDNDGYEDLYVNNQFEPNSFYDCNGTPTCTEIASQVGVRAAFDPVYNLQTDPPEIASYNAAVADVDGDGDMDLLVNNLGHRAELFINHEGQTRNWVRYEIVGLHPNRFAIGGSILTTVGSQTKFSEVYAGGNGYLGQNELTLHVGLGAATKVDQALVRWPGAGPLRTLTNLPANQRWKIYAPARLCDSDGDGVDHDDFENFAGCFLAGFSPGCEMMDFDGDSGIGIDDLDECFVASPADCNGNGTEDLTEIVLDLGLDLNDDFVIDCCAGPPPTKEPNPVGHTLLVKKNGSNHPVLTWSAPPADATHAVATSYNVFRSAGDGFGVLATVGGTTHTDSSPTPGALYAYLVSARNGCGSSGEEPF